MSKSVLIYAKTSQLEPVGGPFGYLNNLKTQLDERGISYVHFIDDGMPDRNKVKHKNTFFRKCGRALKRFKKYFGMLLISDRDPVIENCKDDYIHFHYTEQIFRYRKSLEKYPGKVVLTTHSPTLASIQLYDSLEKGERAIFGWCYKLLKKMDIYAFNRADYIVFPCEEAEEPYLHNWSGYANFKKCNRKKYRYVPTGINACKAKVSRSDIRKKYNIPEDAFVISYVGRHNEIKGYDRVKRIGEKLLKRYKNVFFLIAGIEDPIKGLDDKHWIEVGWTNDPHSYIAASDVFLLPNRETYFDLVMLEVLSLSKCVVASNTGGNKYFKKFEESGIFLFDKDEEAIRYIENLQKYELSDRDAIGERNKIIFDNNFNCNIFCDNYLKMLDSLD